MKKNLLLLVQKKRALLSQSIDYIFDLIFFFRSKRERDIWVSRIAETCQDYKEKCRKRRSYALQVIII